MRLGADAWDWTQIPASFNNKNCIVLGYDAWPAEAWAKFPLAKKVRIAQEVQQVGLQYCVADVENGDMTFAQARQWILHQQSINALYPTVYVSQSNLSGLRQELSGVTGYSIWLAWWGHEEAVAGTVGIQLGPQEGPDSYDLSHFYSTAWQPVT
jgi:hypothetical protein